jgi:hypothetical protein
VLLLAAVADASAARAAIPFVKSSLTAEARTVGGEAYWLNRVELTTPRDYAKAAPDEPLFRFQSSPIDLPFEQIRQIELSPTTSRFLGSRPDTLEYYPLGGVRHELPPPPNWKRTHGQIPPWKRVRAIAEVDHLPFLNHAVFCWADGTDRASGERQADVFLFRQPFQIDEPAAVGRATLHLATNAEILEVTFNEHPINLPDTRSRLLASFEVTPLLEAGPNILALRVREKTGTVESAYGLAFRLDLTGAGDKAPRNPRPDGMALALGRNGDRVWGWIEDLQGNQVRLLTPYGSYSQDLIQLNGLLMPAGWGVAPDSPGLFGRLLGGGDKSPRAETPAPQGLPLDAHPEPIQDRLLLTEGRSTTARPGYVRGADVVIEGAEGKNYAVPKSQFLGIYPPRPVDWTLRKPQRDDARLYCRLTTVAGERVSGILRRLDGGGALLESDTGGSIMEFPADRIANLAFPYHAPPLRRRGAAVALIGQTAGQEAFRQTFLADTLTVQEAAFSIGVEVELLELAALVEPQKLDPVRFPVLVSVDPVGEFPHTLARPGDGQDALVGYIERGGVMVVLSRGGAFRTALIQSEKGLLRSADEVRDPSMLARLGLATIRPGENSPRGALVAKAFNHPPNALQEIFFQRSSEAPEELLGLPRRILIDPTLSARFYPMVSTQGAASVIYEIRDETGMAYGPALSLVPKGRGTLVIIDHLLWNSRPDGEPFSERILPALLRWALEAATPR